MLKLYGIPGTVRADERKLKQIMYNLLSNAVKFTPDGGAVSVKAREIDCVVRPGLRSSDPGDLHIIKTRLDGAEAEGMKRVKGVELSVSDTGIGIRRKYQERIFNPFEQADGSSRRSYQGTGLGLSLTKNLVELHGGKIWVESEGDDRGSTFNFIIPV